jgi:glycosyltransferase involved in cell wall biosynthesis
MAGTLYIISSAYPFGKGETFMDKELKELSKYFTTVRIFPLSAKGDQRALPENVVLDLSLAKVSRNVPKNFFIKYFRCYSQILLDEFLHSDKKMQIIKSSRDLINSVLQAKMLSEVFLKNYKKGSSDYFYSVWMDDGALMYSILKKEGAIGGFFFRLHGYDLFDERREGGYMPFRYTNFKHADKVFILSQTGYDYLLKKNIFPEKLVVNYSGLYDQGENPMPPVDQELTIVSCSNVIRLKRLDKIINVLKLLKHPVRWIHFGDGDDMQRIRKLASEMPPHVSYDLKGHVNNEDLIRFYRQQPVHMFLHLSESEGLGMAIVEANSFGIPAAGISAGGVKDVINDQCGLLLPENADEKHIAESVTEFFSKSNSADFRHLVKKQWEKRFEAVRNYKYFYDLITGTKK